MWLHDETWEIPVLHFGSPPPVAAKKKKTKKSKEGRVDNGDTGTDSLGGGILDFGVPAVEGPRQDPVNHPAHYTRFKGIEVIQLTEQLNFNVGNAVKYLARAGHKDDSKTIEDLRKAIWYTEREIERLSND